MAVPEVSVYVAGQLGSQGKEREPREDGYSPNEQQRWRPSIRGQPRPRVAEERDRGQEETGQRRCDPVQPSESGHGRYFQEARKYEETQQKARAYPVAVHGRIRETVFVVPIRD